VSTQLKQNLDSGFWILDSGFWILDSGFWILDSLRFNKVESHPNLGVRGGRTNRILQQGVHELEHFPGE
jgi:hypothetical protein